VCLVVAMCFVVSLFLIAFFFGNSMLLVLFVEKIEEMWGELVKCLS